VFGVQLDRLDDQVQFVCTVDLSRHAAVLVREGTVDLPLEIKA